MDSPRIALDPAPQASERQGRETDLNGAAGELPTPSATGVVPAHYQAVKGLISQTRSLLAEAARINGVGGTAATDFGSHEKDAAADVARTPIPSYGEK